MSNRVKGGPRVPPRLPGTIAAWIIGLGIAGAACFGGSLVTGSYDPSEWVGLWRADALDSDAMSYLAFAFFALGFGGILIFVALVRSLLWITALIGPGIDPDRPWLQRADWAAGRSEALGDGRGRTFLIPLLLLTVLAVLFGLWTSRLILEGETSNWILIFAWAPTIVAGLGLRRALRRFRSQLRFGTSVLEMDAVPALIGEALSGRVRTTIPADQSTAEGFEVRLSCIRRIYGGQSGDTRDVTLAQQSSQVEGVQDPVSRFIEIPISLPIPDRTSMGDLSSSRSVRWYLYVKGSLLKGEYSTRILVPVYRSTLAEPSSA